MHDLRDLRQIWNNLFPENCTIKSAGNITYMVTLCLSNFESQPSYSLDINQPIIIFLRFQSTNKKARHSLNLSRSPPPLQKKEG